MTTIKSLFSSKKFLVAFAGVISEVLVVTVSGLPDEVALNIGGYIAGIVSAYVLGQGIADNGKERAKIEGGAFADKEAA